MCIYIYIAFSKSSLGSYQKKHEIRKISFRRCILLASARLGELKGAADRAFIEPAKAPASHDGAADSD